MQGNADFTIVRKGTRNLYYLHDVEQNSDTSIFVTGTYSSVSGKDSVDGKELYVGLNTKIGDIVEGKIVLNDNAQETIGVRLYSLLNGALFDGFGLKIYNQQSSGFGKVEKLE